MRRKILASLLLAGALSGLYRLGAQTPEPVALTVRPTESKEFTFKQVDRDVYEVTTAPGSAVIRFEPVKGSLAEGISVLSFDYFCASGMEFMVVMVNDDRSRIEENMIRLPIAEGWSTFSVDVTDKLKRLQGPDDYLSLLIVPNAARPTTMRIRNARLRAYTEKEREQARLKTERERREKQLNADIEVYLKKNYPCEVSRVTVNDDRVEVSGNIVPYKVGSYTLTYSVTNDRGDTTTAERHINVVPAQQPDSVKPDNPKTIYLTFDDGPGPYTAQLLDVLARYNVKATFFVTALNSDYEDMIGRAYNEGHSIAVHTYSHDYRKIYASEEAFFEDFNAMEDVIYRQTGQYTKLCRFPGGSSNTVSQFNPGVMSRLVDIMNNMGYKYFDWNVDSDDAGHTKTTNGIYTNVTEGCYAAAGYGYCIVLQHDVKDYSVAAIESIINWGLNNGYTFAALDMTSPTAHHGLYN